MAVAYISDADGAPVGANFSFTSFAVSGTDPVIVVMAEWDDATATVTNVSCSAGLTGTPLEVKTVRNGNAYITIWAIPAPSGTGTITVTASGSRTGGSFVQAVLLQGAHQTTPCPLADAASATSGDPITVTPANLTANDAVVGTGAVKGGDNPAWTTGTQIFYDNGASINVASGYHLGTGAVAVDFGVSATNVMAAVRVAAAGAAGGPDLTVVLVEPSITITTF